MDCRFVHQLRYRFSQPARNCQLRLMLEPREMPHQQVLFSQIHVRSPSSTQTRLLDKMGNAVAEIHVVGPVRQLQVKLIHTLRLVSREEAAPATYPSDAAYDAAASDALHLFREYAAPSFQRGANIARSARSMCQRIHHDFRYESRTLTDAHPAAQVTLERRAGNCEELAQVALACLHSLNVPAYFVSGYLLSNVAAAQQGDRLHAWVLVNCGDGRWLELDPTTGGEANEAHVLIAWGPDATTLRPLTGSFEGGGEQQLTTTLFVERLGTQ